MNTEDEEFRRIEAEIKRRATVEEDDDTQTYTSAQEYLYRLGYEAGAAAEPVCPACKAALLYECVACSNNNYPPQQDGLAQPKQEPVAYCYVKKTSSADALTFNPNPANAVDNTVFPLYTTPPQRKPLTDEEKRMINKHKALQLLKKNKIKIGDVVGGLKLIDVGNGLRWVKCEKLE